jgi:hypothetical protein
MREIEARLREIEARLQASEGARTVARADVRRTGFRRSAWGRAGTILVPMANVHIVRSFQNIPAVHNMYRPGLCVVLKGAKEMLFGDTTLRYEKMECFVVSVDIPASGRMVGAR